MRAEEEVFDADEFARGIGLLEERSVDLVEFRVQAEIGAGDFDVNQIVHGHVGLLEGPLDREHYQARFFGGIGWGFAGGREHAEVATDVQGFSERETGAEWAIFDGEAGGRGRGRGRILSGILGWRGQACRNDGAQRECERELFQMELLANPLPEALSGRILKGDYK